MMTKKQIDEFETLQGQLESFHSEMNALVRKNPNDALNKFKLGLINSVLKKANVLLAEDRRPFLDFEQFHEESMPSTSDVLMIVSQYQSAFEKLRADNAMMKHGQWYWICSEDDKYGEPSIRMATPKKLAD